MARGQSGRIVVEIDPQEKRDLYRALNSDELTLKDWFLQTARAYLIAHDQPSLFTTSSPSHLTNDTPSEGQNELEN